MTKWAAWIDGSELHAILTSVILAPQLTSEWWESIPYEKQIEVLGGSKVGLAVTWIQSEHELLLHKEVPVKDRIRVCLHVYISRGEK